MRIHSKTIKQTIIVTTVLVVGLFIIPLDLADAQVPALLNFTGKITNLDGSEVADGNYNFTFAIYDQAYGGTALWSETLASTTRFRANISGVSVTATGTNYTYGGEVATSTLRLGQYLSNGSASGTDPALITDFDTVANTISVASGSTAWLIGQQINNRPFVEGGVINIHLGSVTDISSLDFSQTRYLEVIFNSETMQPRKVLTTVAASFDAARLDGKTGAEYAALAEDETITGEWSFNNIVSIATTSDTTALTVTQNGAGDIVEFSVGASTSLAVLNDGRVQVGNYYFPTTHGTAGYVLKTDISGNLYWDVDFGGLGGSGLWATSSNELLMRQVNPGLVVVIGNIATSTFPGYKFEVEGASLFDRVSVTNQEQLRLYDADSSNYIALRATTTMTGDFVLSLPDGVGTPGQALVTDGSGNLYWGTPSGGTVYANAGTAGQLAYYETAGVTVSGTSSIYLSDIGYFAIGTTTATNLLTIGGTSGSQFMVNDSGQVVAGTWQGDILDDQFGGFGVDTSGWTGLAYRDGSAWSATSVLSILAGGTGATTATGVRANLGLVFDQDILTFDSDLYTIANLGVIDDGFLVGSTTGNWVVESGDEVRSSLGLSNIYTYAIDSTPGTYGSVWISNTLGRGEYIATSSLGLPVGSGGGAGFVTYWQDTVTLTSEQYLSAGRGGLGADSSGWTGLAFRDGSAWMATTVLSVAFGGTGTTTFQANALLYAPVDNMISEIPPGSNGYALVMQSGVPTWASTSPGSTHDILSAMHSDATPGTVVRGDLITGQGASATWTRLALGTDNFILASDGTDIVWDSFELMFASELNATTTDALSQGSTNRYYSTLLFSADMDATTTDALGQGSTNLYWSDSLFDARLAATTSLPNLINLSGLSGVGIIATGTWQGDVISVIYGGTGTSTFEANSLVYASADNTISEILPGPNGYALTMLSGVPTWSSTSPGTAHGILSVLHSDTENTGTLVRGDLMVANSNDLWDRLALGTTGYILYSDGTDAIWSTTTAITALGIIAQGTWQADTIQIAFGGTGATTATGARGNLGLTDIYKFGITSTGTDGFVWISDGDGRGYWLATSSLGIAGTGGDSVSRFVGTTTVTTDGSISSSTLVGYAAANDICVAEYSGSHFCHVYDIIVTIQLDDISYWGNDISDGWVAEGPPGFTADSNDCTGWTSNATNRLGAFWMFNDNGGGAGWLVNCGQVKPIACCSRQ